MRRPLFQLVPGTRFREPGLCLTGTVLMVNDCRAYVRIDQPQVLVEFTSPDQGMALDPVLAPRCGARRSRAEPQTARSGRASRSYETSWAPTVVVEALSVEPPIERDTTMAMKTTKQAPVKKTTKSAAKAATKTTRAAKADGKFSQLDAAVKVLSESGAPMTTKAMIEAMEAKGYWTSPGGETPAATLFSALIREIAKKGDDARFTKVERGQFALKQ